MIDCDIHPQVGDPEELLAYVDPAQRDWFRAQGPSLGLPGYSWAHPSSWFRQDIEQNGHPPASDVDAVRRELLDPSGTDVGRPQRRRRRARLADPEPVPRRRAGARAQRVAARALARRRAAAARVDPLPGAGPAGRRRRDPARGRGRALRPGAPLRRRRPAVRRAALPADLRGRRRGRAAGGDPLRRRGHGDRRAARRRRPGHLLHRVAHARLGLLDDVAPRLAALPRDVRALPRR